MLIRQLRKFMSALSLRFGVFSLSLFLIACQSSPAQGVGSTSVSPLNVQTDVREPSVSNGAGLQVKPLQNPGQRNLLQQARTEEAAGNVGKAEELLMQALKIQPRDPEILQELAEIKLQQQQFEQANAFAQRSYVVGPQLGEICSRNWLTIAAVRRHYQNHEGAFSATRYAEECAAKPPERF